MSTKTAGAASPMVRRLSADAWQHVMAGHLADYCRENGRWIFRLAGDTSPYGDDEAGVTDGEFRAMLEGLPAHGQPVTVAAKTAGGIVRGEGGRFVLVPRKVAEYPELAGGGTVTKISDAPSKRAGKPAARKVPAKIEARPVAAVVDGDELAAYVARLVHEPKRAYAAALVAAAAPGRDLAEVDAGSLSDELAGKVAAKVARLLERRAVAA